MGPRERNAAVVGVAEGGTLARRTGAEHRRRAGRVAALVTAGEYERAIGAAVGVDRHQLAAASRTGFLIDVAQAQFGLGWYGDALWTLSRAQVCDAAKANGDVAVRLMVHAIARQRREVLDTGLLAAVVGRLRTTAA